MLVNISYSIEFEEVPEKVVEFVKEVQALNNVVMAEKLNVAVADLKNNNYTEAIKNIDEAREILLKVDMRLNDSSSILKGYAKELIEPTQEHPNASDPDLSSLQQNLANLKQNIEENINGNEDR